MARTKLTLSLLGIAVLLISGCSGVKGGTTSGGGTGGGTGGGGTGGGTGGGGPFTVGGTIIGLNGTGLILENNGTDDLTVTGTGTFTFTFKNTVTGNYKVIIKQEPSAPIQNCSVTNGTGTATAKVTSVQVTCVPVFTVGGSVSGLAGTGLVLANNVTDTVKVSGTGNVNFTFPTPLASGAT